MYCIRKQDFRRLVDLPFPIYHTFGWNGAREKVCIDNIIDCFNVPLFNHRFWTFTKCVNIQLNILLKVNMVKWWLQTRPMRYSRSLRKGQGHSNYTLYVKQSFMIIVHIIHKVVHLLDAIQEASISFTVRYSCFFGFPTFFGLIITEETWLIEMHIWCNKVGIVLVLHWLFIVLHPAQELLTYMEDYTNYKNVCTVYS
jgi:hypothetical protein